MLSIAKRTAPGVLILLIMPVAVGLSGWRWHPDNNAIWLRFLYWVTETVSQPWGVMTHLLLCGWFLWCLRFRFKPALMLLVLLSLTIITGQGIKSWIKHWTQEPRPYVVWLEEKHQVPVVQFYALKHADRARLVQRQLQNEREIPGWLRAHWRSETGFAFPSGHTLFASCWALLAVGLLWPRRRFITMTLVMVWAIAVMGSRLALGMHWPRDLVVASLLSWLLAIAACWFAQRLCGSLAPPAEECLKAIHRKR